MWVVELVFNFCLMLDACATTRLGKFVGSGGVDQMNRADYRGARGSLAGTSFQDLWALPQAMKLLDTSSGISAVAVEGRGQETDGSVDVTEFDGVDCTVLYGSADVAAASRIELVQLKYSGSRLRGKWTLSKLI
jgi:hypothetical protein